MVWKNVMEMAREKYSFIMILMAGILLILSLEASAKGDSPVRLRFLTSSVGTAWYMMGGAMGEAIKSRLPSGSQIDVAPLAGSVANLPMLMKGDGDLAYTFSVVYQWAWDGIAVYEKKPIRDLRIILGNFDTYWLSFAVRKETGLTSFEQLKEKKFPLRVATGDKTTIQYYAIQHILGAYGMSLEDIERWGGKVISTTWPHIVSMIKDKNADAVLWVNTPGHPSWTELAITRDLFFLPIQDHLLRDLSQKYGYAKGMIPTGAFKGVSEDVPVLGFCTVIIIRKDQPNPLAYAVAKGICDGAEKLKDAHKMFTAFEPRNAWKGFENYLHPGSAAFFKERNWMK